MCDKDRVISLDGIIALYKLYVIETDQLNDTYFIALNMLPRRETPTPTSLRGLEARIKIVLQSFQNIVDALGEQDRATVEAIGQNQGVLENLPPPPKGGAHVDSSLRRDGLIS